MLGCAGVIGIETHHQHIIIHEPVIAARSCIACIHCRVGHGEMFFKVNISAIVVSGYRRQCKTAECTRGQVARILCLICPMLHLVAETKKEAGVREVLAGFFQCVFPSVLIVFNISAGADLRVAGRKKGKISEAACIKCINITPSRLAAAHAVGILCIFFQVCKRRVVYILSAYGRFAA